MDPAALYRLPPEEFTAARDAAAKQAEGEQRAALKALRRPSVAAWLVNRLSDAEGELLGQLLELGPALAQAQAGGEGDALRTLGAQRRELVAAVAARAVELADRPVTAAVREEVAATLEAALADPSSAEAVRSGRLVRALAYAGFGGVDLEGAVAAAAPPGAREVRSAPPRPRDRTAERAEQHRLAVAEAEAAAHEAAGRLDDAVRAAGRAQGEVEAVQQRVAAATARRDELAAELERARTDLDAVTAEHGQARAAAEQAVAAAEQAQQAAEQARAALDRLRRS